MNRKLLSVTIAIFLITNLVSIAFAQQIKPLTDNDRKLYTLTVDKAKISAPRDTLIKTYKNKKGTKAKAITVPLILHNNSNDTLKFYSMTCSWGSFYGTNSPDISLPDWACEYNAPKIVTVAPYKTYQRDVSIVYSPTVKSGKQYQISMSLLKAPDADKRKDFFWPEDYASFNKIWSNEITIK